MQQYIDCENDKSDQICEYFSKNSEDYELLSRLLISASNFGHSNGYSVHNMLDYVIETDNFIELLYEMLSKMPFKYFVKFYAVCADKEFIENVMTNRLKYKIFNSWKNI
jgi:hypothetical protein